MKNLVKWLVIAALVAGLAYGGYVAFNKVKQLLAMKAAATAVKGVAGGVVRGVTGGRGGLLG